jgi:CheY-like chemotaxis protein
MVVSLKLCAPGDDPSPNLKDGTVKSYNILVVEDDPIIGILLVDILLGMGHSVCGLHASASVAVASALLLVPDILLVDVRLGSDSGIAAVAEIRRSRQIPYIYMSGALIPVGRPNDVVLYKPFFEADLAAAIQRVAAA